MAKKSFMQGALILAVAGVIIKIMGACFRIPLGNIIGDEGMGYYQSAYPVYVLFLTLATAGVPVAISKLISERVAVGNNYEAYRVFRVSFILLFAMGVISSSILFFGADVISQFTRAPGAKPAMMAIAPALLFVPMMASYRGYFQGYQDMKPTAISQIVEQFFRVIIGYTLATVLVSSSLQFAAAGAAFGATAGAIAGIVAMIFIYLKRKKAILLNVERNNKVKGDSSIKILTQIFTISIPITLGAAIMPIMNTIDLGIVMRRLHDTGWSADTAISLYGQLTGMAAPIINFPQILTQAIAISIVPAVAAAYRQKDSSFLKYNIQLGVRTAMLIGLPCSLGIMTLSEPIMVLLFPLQRASAISAAPCLFVMGFSVIFLSIAQTLSGVLQGLGKQMIPVINLFYGVILKIILTYILTGIHDINVKGAAIGTAAAYAIASILNIIAVKKQTGLKFDITLTFIKPITCGVVMSAFVWLSYRVAFGIFGNAVSTIFAVCVGAFIYGGMLFITKAITNEELKTLPKGDKIVSLINKFKNK
ncbi:putative polysaccharide biosynthesis protein [Anaerovorax odorimutans]|uniref:putative polysaccharide biosynthesis protein n=1 Tax=Anaerovorax odorimutans TaxID=109327 RepID=UPI00040EECE1|nr:polysaccharide biosynthesis protein [Anaerovorax odorimutans]